MQKTSLKKIAKIYNGNSINAKTKAEKYSLKCNGWSYIGTKDVNFDGSVSYDNGIVIPLSDATFKIAPAQSIFVCSEGGSAGKKTAYIDRDVCFGNKLYAIVNDKGLFCPKYIYYYTRYREFFEQFKKLMNGIIGGVSSKKFGEIEIPLPSLPEQELIVQKIEELFADLDKGVEELKQAKARLKVYRQAVLKEAFLENEYLKLSILFDCIIEKPRNGYSPKAVTYETKYKNLTLTATTSEVFKGENFKYVDIDIQEDSYLWLKKNDILIQRANTIEYVGASAIYDGDDYEYVYPDLMMKVQAKDDFLPKFILYQLQSEKVRTYFRDNATGTAGNMPKINQKTVMNAPIFSADKNTQTAL